jgi:hypothetical protein
LARSLLSTWSFWGLYFLTASPRERPCKLQTGDLVVGLFRCWTQSYKDLVFRCGTRGNGEKIGLITHRSMREEGNSPPLPRRRSWVPFKTWLFNQQVESKKERELWAEAFTGV